MHVERWCVDERSLQVRFARVATTTSCVEVSRGVVAREAFILHVTLYCLLFFIVRM